MDFNIKVRRNEGKVIVLEMSGKLQLGEPVTLLRQTIQAQLQRGETKFLMDMSGVSSVDSSALGEMVGWATTVQSKGGSLELTGLDKNSTTVIRLTGLGPVLTSPSPISQNGRKTHWKNYGIALAIVVVVAAFYWIAGR